MFQRVMVCVDSSINSQHVFETALAFAKKYEATLMIIHVLSGEQEDSPNLPPSEPGYNFPIVNSDTYMYYQSQWNLYEKRGLAMLENFVNKAKADGVNAESQQNIGSPGRQTCETARLWKADLIVTGRRGYSGLSELFLGSISNYILHNAPCSVFVVQPPIDVETTPVQAKEIAHST
jgi:nucleotide-binding universal stress UspA family protein